MFIDLVRSSPCGNGDQLPFSSFLSLLYLYLRQDILLQHSFIPSIDASEQEILAYEAHFPITVREQKTRETHAYFVCRAHSLVFDLLLLLRM